MTQTVEYYYTEMPRPHQIAAGQLPAVLNGEPIALVPEDERLLVANPSNPNWARYVEAYQDVITGLGGFTLACASASEREQDDSAAASASVANGRHFRSIISSLRPGGLLTGVLSKVQIRAVTPDEAKSHIVVRHVLSLKGLPESEADAVLGRSVLLITSANVTRSTGGRPLGLGYTAFLTGIKPARGPAMAVRGLQFPKSDLRKYADQWRPH